jgi:hypothetical protein
VEVLQLWSLIRAAFRLGERTRHGSPGGDGRLLKTAGAGYKMLDPAIVIPLVLFVAGAVIAWKFL